MSPFTTPSIRDRGLQQHLDEFYAHKGGYVEFVNQVKYGVPKTKLAKHFGVNRATIDKWIEIYKELA